MQVGITRVALVGAMLLSAVSVSGCATKKFVREEVATVDAKVQAQEQRLTQVDGTAREALERATAAGKLAEGKFMYQLVLTDDSVKFPLNASQLSPEAEQRLAEFAQRLKSENKNVYVEVQGHTDSTGDPSYNERLGSQRAEAVRRYLNQQGVALNRVATISYGEDQPVAPNDTREGRAQNRRVVVIVLA